MKQFIATCLILIHGFAYSAADSSTVDTRAADDCVPASFLTSEPREGNVHSLPLFSSFTSTEPMVGFSSSSSAYSSSSDEFAHLNPEERIATIAFGKTLSPDPYRVKRGCPHENCRLEQFDPMAGQRSTKRVHIPTFEKNNSKLIHAAQGTDMKMPTCHDPAHHKRAILNLSTFCATHGFPDEPSVLKERYGTPILNILKKRMEALENVRAQLILQGYLFAPEATKDDPTDPPHNTSKRQRKD